MDAFDLTLAAGFDDSAQFKICAVETAIVQHEQKNSECRENAKRSE
jgi:hypothetical protein